MPKYGKKTASDADRIMVKCEQCGFWNGVNVWVNAVVKEIAITTKYSSSDTQVVQELEEETTNGYEAPKEE